MNGGAHLFPRLRPNTPWLIIHKRQAAKLVHAECLKGVLDEGGVGDPAQALRYIAGIGIVATKDNEDCHDGGSQSLCCITCAKFVLSLHMPILSNYDGYCNSGALKFQKPARCVNSCHDHFQGEQTHIMQKTEPQAQKERAKVNQVKKVEATSSHNNKQNTNSRVRE